MEHLAVLFAIRLLPAHAGRFATPHGFAVFFLRAKRDVPTYCRVRLVASLLEKPRFVPSLRFRDENR